jgi:polysaccharide export outer membrane protein
MAHTTTLNTSYTLVFPSVSEITTYCASCAFRGLMICFLFCAVSCSSHNRDGHEGIPMPIPASERPSVGNYKIQVGDLIDVFVLEDSTFNGTFVIRPSGDIIMPKVGRVGVQGLSLTEAEARIQQTLQGNQLKQASVIVDPGTRGETGGGLTVRMSGEIGQTGRVTVRPLGEAPASAYQAIVDAGGFKPFANKRKSYILRNSASGVARIEVNFEAVEAGKADDPLLMEGDCVVVPKKMFGL